MKVKKACSFLPTQHPYKAQPFMMPYVSHYTVQFPVISGRDIEIMNLSDARKTKTAFGIVWSDQKSFPK